MTAGLPKLNTRAMAQQTSSVASTKASLSTATRSSGVSYGIMAQRSIFSTGVLRNPKMAYSGSVAYTRMMLNANRPMMFAGVMPHKHNDNNDNSMNKFMTAMMAMNMISEMTQGITSGIKEIKAAKTAKADTANATDLAEMRRTYKSKYTISQRSDGTFSAVDKDGKPIAKASSALELWNKLEDIDTGKTTPSTSTTSTTESTAGSQSNMEKYTSNLKSNSQSIATFGTNYNDLSIQGELPNLSDLGVNDLQDLKLSDLDLSDLNLSESSSIEDIGNAIDTISNDVNNVARFQKALATNIGKLNSAYGTANNDDKAKILKAIEELTTFQDTNLKLFAQNVNNKEEDLKNLRLDKKQIMNNIAEQAEKDDRQIAKNNDDMRILKSKIENTQEDGTEKSDLIDKYNALADENLELSTSLLNLGTIQKVNSSFKTSDVELTNLDIAETNHYVKSNTSNTGSPGGGSDSQLYRI